MNSIFQLRIFNIEMNNLHGFFYDSSFSIFYEPIELNATSLTS